MINLYVYNTMRNPLRHGMKSSQPILHLIVLIPWSRRTQQVAGKEKGAITCATLEAELYIHDTSYLPSAAHDQLVGSLGRLPGDRSLS